jgi:ketosteroid isomerase-like protein
VSADVVARFLDYRATGDVEACIALVAEAGTWHSPVGAPKRGRDGFREVLADAFTKTRWFATETLALRPYGATVVAKVRNRGERNGKVLDSVQLLIFRVEEGAIINVRIHVDDPVAVAEFWSDPSA